MKKINGVGSVFYNSNKKLWTAQYIETENGVSKKKCIYGKTKEIVSQKLNKIMYNYHNDNYIRKNGIKFVQVLKQNREDKFAANLISESHYSRLEFVIREIESSPIGNIDIDKITTRDLQDYFNSLINRYTDSTIKKVWECVKQGFEVAMSEKYILENPFTKVLKPKSRKETKVLEALSTKDEQILSSYLLKSNLTDEKYKNVILIQLYSGMRIGEVLALTIDNIDFEKNKIKVRNTLTVDKNGDLIIKQGTKTYSGKRDIPISPFLYTSLKEQVEIAQNNKDNLLFTYEGRLIKASSVNTVLKRICKQLELPSTISNHTLRHTFGTRCIESGMQPKVVQTLMGHKDISVTLNTYTSVLNQFKEDEFNKLAQYYLNKNINTLPDTIELNKSNYTLCDGSEEYRYDNNNFNIYDAYKFSKEQIISLFGSKENYLNEQVKAEETIKKYLNKINKNKNSH